MTSSATRLPDGQDAPVSSPWFVIALSEAQVNEGHLMRIVATFTDVFIAAGSPSGAAMFGVSFEDGRRDLYLNPPAAALAKDLIPANRAQPCSPPLDEGDMVLIVGHQGDRRLLSS